MVDEPNFEVIDSNRPVEFPPAELGFQTKEGELDIEAKLRSESRDRYFLTIECKKNNPDFTSWIFFQMKIVGNECVKVPIVQISPSSDRTAPTYTLSRTSAYLSNSLLFSDQGRETKGTFNRTEKPSTKTSNAAISDAAYQVALSTQSTVYSRILESRRGTSPLNIPENRSAWNFIVLPVILTTADLFVCDFDPGEVDPTRGEIPWNEVKLTKVPYLIYRYSMPLHLQRHFELYFELKTNRPDEYLRIDTFVVNAEHFKDFLNFIRISAHDCLWI